MKRKSKVECMNCDSEYMVTYTLGSTEKEQPVVCCFCGEELDCEEDEDEEELAPSYID